MQPAEPVERMGGVAVQSLADALSEHGFREDSLEIAEDLLDRWDCTVALDPEPGLVEWSKSHRSLTRIKVRRGHLDGLSTDRITRSRRLRDIESWILGTDRELVWIHPRFRWVEEVPD